MAQFGFTGKPEPTHLLLFRVVVEVVALPARNREHVRELETQAEGHHRISVYYLGVCADSVDGRTRSGRLPICFLAIGLAYGWFMGCGVLGKIWWFVFTAKKAVFEYLSNVNIRQRKAWFKWCCEDNFSIYCAEDKTNNLCSWRIREDINRVFRSDLKKISKDQGCFTLPLFQGQRDRKT